MLNRSMPPGVIVPELAYRDVREAVDWLCRVFGFSERLRIGSHRAQLVFGGASVIVTHGTSKSEGVNHAVMVRVVDVDAHYEQARTSGAKIISLPTDYEFGERQYSVEDLGGHHWVFSQSIADIDPQEWGGMLFESK
jgi:uncharacterized glyoxalase superfamily protein PhnB